MYCFIEHEKTKDHNKLLILVTLKTLSILSTRLIQVNNAGVLLNERQLTPEGYEMSFATNTLGTYLLTELMMPVLESSAPSRVVC